MPKGLANAQELVRIDAIRDDTVILRGGALRQIVMVGGINFALKSEAEQNAITQGYQNFLNGLDFSIQIIIRSRKVNIENYLKHLDAYKINADTPLLQNQIEEYQEFIRGFVAKNSIMEKTFFVVIPYDPINLPSTQSLTSSLPFFKKPTQAAEEAETQKTEDTYQQNLQQLKQRVDEVLGGLTTVGLETAILNNEQIIELFYNFYNPETVGKDKAEAKFKI